MVAGGISGVVVLDGLVLVAKETTGNPSEFELARCGQGVQMGNETRRSLAAHLRTTC